MGGFKIQVTGLDKALKKLDVKKFNQDITDELNAFGFDVSRDAKQLVPVDEGFLKNSISHVHENLSVEIVASANYAGYVEFGTRKFAAEHVASLPAEWQELARESKGGGGGSFIEFIQRLIGWCKRKGIDEKAAYPIAKKILVNGVKAQPFLFPAYEKNRPLLIERLKKLLDA